MASLREIHDTSTPIDGLAIRDKAQRLSDETLGSWEKSWGAQAGRLEMVNGQGKPWTKQEKESEQMARVR